MAWEHPSTQPWGGHKIIDPAFLNVPPHIYCSLLGSCSLKT